VADDDASDKAGMLDLRTVKILAALMSRHDLSEINLREGTLHIRLRRGPRNKGVTQAAAPPPAAAVAPAAAPPKAEGAAEKPARQLVEIKSPTPGTFYAQEKPGSPPYVTVGSRVTPTTVVCQIEAMKIFNEIQAECSGVIAEVLAENKEAVEYGQVLFRVDPAG
jgi:acetyl-CoA carboxylase biotin carboxyl carrier protein